MTPLRVLMVEDNPDDVTLVVLELRRAGFKPQLHQVQTAEELRAALLEADWDVVLSDYWLPRFNAPEALRVLRESGRDVPFIVVSGSVAEEAGVEVMRAGARDYMPKDRLARLSAAVQRELEEAAGRRARAREAADRELLAQASEALAGPLDMQQRLDRLVQVPVPRVADGCSVLLAREGGALRLAALCHRDPQRARQALELEALYPLRMEARVGPAQVLRTGQPELVEMLPARLESLAHDEAHLRGMLALGVHSAVHVPLQGREGPMGVLALATGEGRRLGPADLALAQELARRTSLALENARLYQEAQEAVRLRDEFLAVAAHELRTPLTTLRLQLSSLRQRGGREGLPQEVDARLERLGRQVRRLGALVEGLLDVSRLSSGELLLCPERMDLAELVEEVVARLGAQAEAAGCPLCVEAESGLYGRWDRVRLDQAVGSLLENALKFGPGQPVEVRAWRQGALARLEVKDRGIGIAPEQRERIFERFERAVSSRSYGGLGLGLYLARRTAQASGGRVWADSREGGGACFTLELPLETSQEGA